MMIMNIFFLIVALSTLLRQGIIKTTNTILTFSFWEKGAMLKLTSLHLVSSIFLNLKIKVLCWQTQSCFDNKYVTTPEATINLLHPMQGVYLISHKALGTFLTQIPLQVGQHCSHYSISMFTTQGLSITRKIRWELYLCLHVIL